MPSLEVIYDALNTVILERFAAQRGGNPGSAFVAFEFGTPVPEDTFRLKDEARTLSAELATEFLSRHADTVPEVQDMMFRRSERTVEDQYGLMLTGAAAATAANAEFVGAVKRSAVVDFDHTLGSLVGPFQFRPVIATPITWYDSSKADNWVTVKIDQSNAPPSAPQGSRPAKVDAKLLKWRVASEALKPALSQPVSAATFRNLRVESPLAVAATLVEGRRPEVATAIRAVAQPAFAGRSGSIGLAVLGRLAGGTISDAKPPASAPASPIVTQSERFSPILANRAALQLESTIGKEASEQNVAAERFSLEVGICMVELKRPWLSDAMLTLPGWYVPGFAKGAFSSGSAEHTGHMPIIPTACIFIRNVRIESQWSDADQKVIENSTNLGGFSLLGRVFDRNNMTLTIPGMQSFAWICEPMPLLPPADPPS